MDRCPLDPETLERALIGSLDPQKAGELARHLEGECPGCQAALDAAGLGEEDLMLCLEASTVTTDLAESTERVWENVRTRLPATSTAGSSWWRLPRVLSFAAAAAVLLLVVLIWPRTDKPGGQTVKGLAPLARATLEILPSKTVYSDGDTIEFRYTLDRPALLRLLHSGPGKKIATLHDSRCRETADWLRVTGDHLGYRFEGEPGRHLFVLIAGDEPLPADATLPGLQGSSDGRIRMGQAHYWASWREIQVGEKP
jgi:hypothetical protein